MMRFELDNSIGNNGQNNRWNESYIELRVWNQVKPAMIGTFMKAS